MHKPDFQEIWDSVRLKPFVFDKLKERAQDTLKDGLYSGIIKRAKRVQGKKNPKDEFLTFKVELPDLKIDVDISNAMQGDYVENAKYNLESLLYQGADLTSNLDSFLDTVIGNKIKVKVYTSQKGRKYFSLKSISYGESLSKSKTPTPLEESVPF